MAFLYDQLKPSLEAKVGGFMPNISLQQTGRGEDDQSELSDAMEVVENPPDTLPYQKNTILEDTEKFKIFVKLYQVRRDRNYQVLYHIYRIRVQEKENETIFVRNMTEAFKKAIGLVLDHLRGFYNADNHHQVYITLLEEDINAGLNTGKSAGK